MHMQEPVENLILWKTARVNLGKLFRVCYRGMYHAKKQNKKIILKFIPGLAIFSPRLSGLVQKTFRRHLGHLLNVLYTFILRSVSKG